MADPLIQRSMHIYTYKIYTYTWGEREMQGEKERYLVSYELYDLRIRSCYHGSHGPHVESPEALAARSCGVWALTSMAAADSGAKSTPDCSARGRNSRQWKVP